MFVYQNADRNICVTFEDNKPVKNPEYVLIVDEAAKTLVLEGDDAALEAQITALTAANVEKDKTIETLTAANEEKDKTIEALEARIEELEKSDAE